MDLDPLTRAFGQACASRQQMTPAQYFRIASELLERAPCRLLVVGAGNDTELYVRANAKGHTLVLECYPSWLAQIQKLGCVSALVTYRTRLNQPPLSPCSVPDGMPPSTLSESWDVVIVDGPEGWHLEAPGRQQSIFLAAQLASSSTTVFLHDYERRLERTYARKYLKPPDEVHGRRPALAVFRYSG